MVSKHYASALNKSHLFPDGKPTYDWLQCFLSRHSSLVLKRSSPLEKNRASLTNAQVDEWFELLTKVLNENNLIHCPAQIFNADETGENFFWSLYTPDPFHQKFRLLWRCELFESDCTSRHLERLSSWRGLRWKIFYQRDDLRISYWTTYTTFRYV